MCVSLEQVRLLSCIMSDMTYNMLLLHKHAVELHVIILVLAFLNIIINFIMFC